MLLSLLAFGALLLVVSATVATALGSWADSWWVGELLSHLRPQYILVLGLCLPILVVYFGPAGWLTLIPLLVNIALIAPVYVRVTRADLSPFRTFTALHYNLDLRAAEHARAFDYLRQQAADILLVQELSPELEAQLMVELPDYQVIHSHPMTNTHGTAILLAKDQLTEIQVLSTTVIHLPDYSARPLVLAQLALAGREVWMLSLHIIRPNDEWSSAFQQTEFAAVAEWSRAQQAAGREVFIIGDFNTTPWSTRFQRLVREGQLQNSGQGFGLQPTWTMWVPLWLGLPIDHCLHSAGITIVDRRVGPALGGDHAPLWVQFRP